MALAAASPLFQILPTVASPTITTAFTASISTEITRIIIVCHDAANENYSIYHARDGAGFSTSNLLYANVRIVDEETQLIEAPALNCGIGLDIGDSIGIEVVDGSRVTFTAYGVTADVGQKGMSI